MDLSSIPKFKFGHVWVKILQIAFWINGGGNYIICNRLPNTREKIIEFFRDFSRCVFCLPINDNFG